MYFLRDVFGPWNLQTRHEDGQFQILKNALNSILRPSN